MYKYKLLNTDDFKNEYKKYISKNFLKGSIILTSIVTLFIFLLSYLSLAESFNVSMNFFIFFFSIIILTEISAFIIAYKKEIKKILNIPTNTEVTISFDEKGIYIENDTSLKHVKWNAIHSVVVDRNKLLFLYKATGLVGNFFYLKFFDADGDEIIKDIEKYIMVRRS